MIVVDTHVLVWALHGDPRLGRKATAALESAAADGGVHVSAITPWEIAMLAHKGRLILGQDVGEWLQAALALKGIVLVPIEPSIAVDSVRLPGDFHSDPADRLIIATARHLAIPLLTADRAINAYGANGYVGVIDASA
jgi:PIN domain nuclease of toxin-antitoxin system